MRLRSVAIAALVAGLSAPCQSRAENLEKYAPNRYGVMALAGSSYNPSGTNFWQVGGVAMLDYDKVWRHWAPDGMRFKIEGCVGATMASEPRAVASLDAFALQYLDLISSERVRPYVEAGIGGIYTDFQVEGQGSRVNFNPTLGVGLEFPCKDKSSLFVSVRLHHLSNAGLCDENRGVNSGVLAVGWLY